MKEHKISQLPANILKLNLKSMKVVISCCAVTFIMTQVLTLLLSFAPAAETYLLGKIVNAIDLFLKSVNPLFTLNNVINIVLLTTLWLFMNIASFGKGMLSRSVSDKADLFMKESVLRKLSRISLEHFQTSYTYESINRVFETVGEKVTNAPMNTMNLFSIIISTLSISWILVKVHPAIPIIIIIGTIPLVIFEKDQMNKRYLHENNVESEKTKSWYYYKAAIDKDYAKDVRVYSMLDFILKRYRNITEYINTEDSKFENGKVKFSFFYSLISNALYISCLCIILYLLRKGTATIGDYAMVSTGLLSLRGMMGNIISATADMNVDFLRIIVDYEKLMNLSEEELSNNAVMKYPPSIHFDNVSFKYPQSEKYSLSNITVSIKSGERILMVGENGSGKSTFISLLLGVYRPTSGSVLINEEDINDNLAALRNATGSALQDFIEYQSSVYENILPAQEYREESISEIQRIIDLLDMKEFMNGMEHGYETEIGLFNEDNTNLSGGQWQKLAIARAIIGNKKLIILDEPTAALDPIAESNIYERISEIVEDKTAIFVSHRLGISKLVDRILVFKDGQIIESGSHEELLKKAGLFAKMYETQQKFYV